MNHIFSSAFQGCLNFNKNLLRAILPESRLDNKKTASTASIAKNIFSEVMPHLISISPFYLSKATDFRIVCFSALLYDAGSQLKQHGKWIETASAVCVFIINLVTVVDLLGLGSTRIEFRVAVDGLLIFSTMVRGIRLANKGIQRVILNKNIDKRIHDFAIASIFIMIGTTCLKRSFNEMYSTLAGIKILNSFDSQQQMHAIKYRAIGTLSKEKLCTAVIFDGMSRSTKLIDHLSYPFAEYLYEKCKTRVYTPENSSRFCEALNDAANQFNNSIDIAMFYGHANHKMQRMSINYYFTGDPQEVFCMNQSLKDDAQVFFVGCSTAAKSYSLSLTEKLAQSLPGKEINGFSGYYSGFSTITRFINDRFQHDCYAPGSGVVTKKSHSNF